MISLDPSARFSSGIYRGAVRHRRNAPASHTFRMPIYMMLLDLSEIDEVCAMSPWYSSTGPAAARFRRADYIGPDSATIEDSVRDLVQDRLGFRPAGPVRLLTHLRYFGYCFNPVSFYYCYAPDGVTIEALVAEITNTPWKERHAYAFAWETERAGSSKRFEFDKVFHVSPFMRVEQRCDWRFSAPGRKLGVHMRSIQDDDRIFDATLSLAREEITPRSLRDVLWRYPAMTAGVLGRIHFEALRLWLKRVPVAPHPKRSGRTNPVIMEGEPA